MDGTEQLLVLGTFSVSCTHPEGGTKEMSAFLFRSLVRWHFVSEWLSNLWYRWKYLLRRPRWLLQNMEITGLRRHKWDGGCHHFFVFVKCHIILSALMSSSLSNRWHHRGVNCVRLSLSPVLTLLCPVITGSAQRLGSRSGQHKWSLWDSKVLC